MLTGGTGGQPSELFCALDIGTSKVCALIAQVDDNGQLKVVGAGRVPSQGLRKGVVVNTSEATACIGKAIDEAERTSTLTMESAYVSISGAHISAIGSKGVVDLGKNGRRVVPEDCQRALDQAGGIALPLPLSLVPTPSFAVGGFARSQTPRPQCPFADHPAGLGCTDRTADLPVTIWAVAAYWGWRSTGRRVGRLGHGGWPSVGGRTMGALRMMFKWFCQAWAAGQQGSLGPDTHKWESKM